MQTKACTKCGEVKGLDEFYKDQMGRYGVKSRCKVCAIKIRKEYVQRPEVRERIKEYNRSPEVMEKARLRAREYIKKPEVIERRKEYEQRPEVKKKRREYARIPDVRYRHKEYLKEYYQRPGVMAHMVEWHRKYKRKSKYIKMAAEYNQKPIVTEKRLKYKKESRALLYDSYVKNTLIQQSNGALRASDIPKSLINLKRQSLKLKRLIKQKNDA